MTKFFIGLNKKKKKTAGNVLQDVEREKGA